MFTAASAFSMLLVESITSGHSKIIEQVPCMVRLNPYLLLIPKIFYDGSCIVLQFRSLSFHHCSVTSDYEGNIDWIVLYSPFWTSRVIQLMVSYVLNCATAHYLEMSLISLILS
jgi:hypothetical protein